jgi:phage terminase small subunit
MHIGPGDRRRRSRQARVHKIKRSEGLLRRQRHFILEKLIGQSDKAAALAAGYSLSTAENTKQKIWVRPGVHAEFERLKRAMMESLVKTMSSKSAAVDSATVS